MNQSDNQAFEPSDLYEMRRNRMVSHLSFVIMVVAVFYSVLTYFFAAQLPLVLLTAAFLSGLITYLFGLKKYYVAAKIFGLIAINVVVFFAASSESEDTSLFLYFGATGLASLVIFGYEDRWKGFVFVIFSAFLYMLSRFSDFSPLPFRNFSEAEIKVFFIINVMVFTYISAYILFLLLKANFQSERILQESNRRIKRQNDELIKANAELDRFMYSTSHDMRAPLSSLSGLIKLSELSSGLPEIREYIKMMKGSINNLEKFTLDITDHYRNSRTDLYKEDIKLKTVVEEIIGDLSFANGKCKVEFVTNLTDNICINTDAARLRIVLNNIVSNSIKYSNPTNGTPIVKIHYSKSGTKHGIEITDNGIGIASNHLRRIFDMFYRASESSQGSGLGLYIVKETMGKLQGDINVVSTLGEGTTFLIELPISED